MSMHIALATVTHPSPSSHLTASIGIEHLVDADSIRYILGRWVVQEIITGRWLPLGCVSLRPEDLH